MTMRLLPVGLLLLAAGVGEARPRAMPDFTRYGTLVEQFAEVVSDAREREEFERKPREERLLILFARGAKEFEGKKLTPKWVAEQIFEEWKAVKADTVRPEDERVLAYCAQAFKEHFAHFGVNIPRDALRERWEASKVFVDALDSNYLPLRQAAFRVLVALYVVDYDYDPMAQRSVRVASKRKWEAHIRRASEPRN